MAKHKYEARVDVSGGTEEVQFVPQGDAPRVPSRYRHDPAEFGKFKPGKVYTLDPEKIEEAVESGLAEQQAEQAKAEADAMKDKKPKK
jgi:hypothetical protein